MHPTLDMAFHKIFSGIGDICERTCCHKVGGGGGGGGRGCGQ